VSLKVWPCQSDARQKRPSRGQFILGSRNSGNRRSQRETASRPDQRRSPECDPYFGFSRSFYYQGEKRGYWKLVHIRDDGKERGVTLVPFHQVEAFVREQMEKQAERTHENEQSRSRTTFVGD
jgi:hypothetical protein